MLLKHARHAPAPPRVFAVAAATLIAVVLMSTACRKNDAMAPPQLALDAAAKAIGTAEQTRVADLASPELEKARARLDSARQAAQQNQMELAAGLARSSEAAARLAIAKAEVVKAQVIDDEMERGVRRLQRPPQEINPDVATGG